jgi:hypothetical protein
MMLAATAVAGLLSHWIDAAVLFAAVIVNAIIGFIQQGKAEQRQEHEIALHQGVHGDLGPFRAAIHRRVERQEVADRVEGLETTN